MVTIPISECVRDGLYRVVGEHLTYGVFNGEDTFFGVVGDPEGFSVHQETHDDLNGTCSPVELVGEFMWCVEEYGELELGTQLLKKMASLPWPKSLRPHTSVKTVERRPTYPPPTARRQPIDDRGPHRKYPVPVPVPVVDNGEVCQLLRELIVAVKQLDSGQESVYEQLVEANLLLKDIEHHTYLRMRKP